MWKEAERGKELARLSHRLGKEVAQPLQSFALALLGQAVDRAFRPAAFAGRLDREDQGSPRQLIDRVIKRSALEVQKLILMPFADEALDFIGVHGAQTE